MAKQKQLAVEQNPANQERQRCLVEISGKWRSCCGNLAMSMSVRGVVVATKSPSNFCQWAMPILMALFASSSASEAGNRWSAAKKAWFQKSLNVILEEISLGRCTVAGNRESSRAQAGPAIPSALIARNPAVVGQNCIRFARPPRPFVKIHRSLECQTVLVAAADALLADLPASLCQEGAQCLPGCPGRNGSCAR